MEIHVWVGELVIVAWGEGPPWLQKKRREERGGKEVEGREKNRGGEERKGERKGGERRAKHRGREKGGEK